MSAREHAADLRMESEYRAALRQMENGQRMKQVALRNMELAEKQMSNVNYMMNAAQERLDQVRNYF